MNRGCPSRVRGGRDIGARSRWRAGVLSGGASEEEQRLLWCVSARARSARCRSVGSPGGRFSVVGLGLARYRQRTPPARPAARLDRQARPSQGEGGRSRPWRSWPRQWSLRGHRRPLRQDRDRRRRRGHLPVVLRVRLAAGHRRHRPRQAAAARHRARRLPTGRPRRSRSSRDMPPGGLSPARPPPSPGTRPPATTPPTCTSVARSPRGTHPRPSPATADMAAKLRRVMIAARFRASRPDQPTPQEIAVIRLAWEIAEPLAA